MTTSIDAPLALLGGVLTVASPCVLPILPVVLGGALHGNARSRPLFIVAGFVLAFSAIGLLLAGASQYVVQAHEALRLAGLAVLALLGLAMLWKTPYAWAMAQLGRLTGSLPSGGQRTGKLGALLLGMSLGAVWTPCAGPVLASILVLVAQARETSRSMVLLALYAVGAGIPMLLIAYGGQFARHHVRTVAMHAERLQQAFGVLILATAALFYFQLDALLYARLADFFSL